VRVGATSRTVREVCFKLYEVSRCGGDHISSRVKRAINVYSWPEFGGEG